MTAIVTTPPKSHLSLLSPFPSLPVCIFRDFRGDGGLACSTDSPPGQEGQRTLQWATAVAVFFLPKHCTLCVVDMIAVSGRVWRKRLTEGCVIVVMSFSAAIFRPGWRAPPARARNSERGFVPSRDGASLLWSMCSLSVVAHLHRAPP